MKCFNHMEVNANGTCQHCGKALCAECVSRFDFPLCESCLLTQNSSVSKQLYYGLTVTGIIFIAATYFFYVNIGAQANFGFSLFAGALMAGTYWGWRFLTDYFPSLSMGTTNVWVIYLFIKFIGAYFIGLIVGPYQIFKMFRELNKIQQVKGQITRGEI